MKIHRRLIMPMGIGMLAVMLITGLSLWRITSLFPQTTTRLRQISFEVERAGKIDREFSALSLQVHDAVATGERSERLGAEAARSRLRSLLDELKSENLSPGDQDLLASLDRDFSVMEKKMDRIAALGDPRGVDRALARGLLREFDDLLAGMRRDIDRYQQGNTAEMTELAHAIRGLQVKTDRSLLLILLTVMIVLLGFGVYLFRTVSVPLARLGEGADAISQGNLDFQIRPAGNNDIARLAQRFNDMAKELKRSYADLEHRLLERTQELSAINAVALTLGRTGDLNSILRDSLLTIADSLSNIEPKGGIFLCDSGRERLRLVAHVGLGSEFVQREGVIAMGECLCGRVAETGEMVASGPFCEDPRHTRHGSAEPHSHIIIPVKSRGTVYGVLFLYPTRAFTLKPSDIQLFDAVGSQLGTAVENYRLYGEVKESGERYEDLFENSRDILCTIDTNGVLTAVNQFAARFLGYGKAELIGKNVQEFLTPEGIEAARQAIAGGRAEAGGFLEFEVVKKDGSRAFVEATSRALYRDGTPAGYQISARDVTEQKQLREMLVKAERLAAIGQVGIAFRHEINNPLTTVIGNAELLLERLEGAGDPELLKRLQIILDNGLRIAEIVNRLKAIKVEKTVDYIEGVKMTDLKQG